MWFLYCLTWFSFLIQILFATISLVAGLYYLAELVEEYTVLAKKIITCVTLVVLLCFSGLLLFEDFPLNMLICGFLAQITHLLILKTFPYVVITSPFFISAVLLLIVNHYFAFQYFGMGYHTFSEVMAYFTVCLWMVPFVLFVSLSANDYVLPTTINSASAFTDDSDVVSRYFSKKGKKYGLLTFFNYLKDALLSERSKKAF